MPLLNYTTKVDVYTTIGEIQKQLVKHVKMLVVEKQKRKKKRIYLEN